MSEKASKPKYYYKAYNWYIKILSRRKDSFKCLAVSEYSIHLITFDNDWLDGKEKEISMLEFNEALNKVLAKFEKAVAK